jgi:hypothetical protein
MTLKGFSSVFDATISNDIQDGIIEYYDWELLNKGNYFNVTLGETVDGEDYSRLKVSTSDNFVPGKAWEGFRKNWVWQSGVNFSPAPIVGSNIAKPGISGVYVDNVFYSTETSGTYAHYIDYHHGRVVFDSPIPTGSKVQVEHSYKWINVDYSDSVPWLRDIQSQTLTPSNFDENNDQWNLPADLRVQLPMIAVEMVPSRTFQGYQLGGGQWIKTDVIFHCIAEDEITRNKLVDIVSLQNDGPFYLFDSNAVFQNNDFPIDYRGVPVSGAKTYPLLVRDYNGGLARFTNTTVSKLMSYNTNIFGGIVRITVEGIKLNI